MLEHPKCLNNDKLEQLGWRSAFEVHYGRKSNELVKCGVPVNREKELNVQEVIQQSENLIYERQKRVDEEREKVKNASKKVCDGTVEYYRKKRKFSKYKKGEEVFIRYGKKNRKKAPKQRFVILGQVIKVDKNKDMYKIKFTSLVSQVSKSEWFSVEVIAYFKKKLKDNKHDLKRRKQQYQKSLLIPLTKEDRLAAFFEQGYSVFV